MSTIENIISKVYSAIDTSRGLSYSGPGNGHTVDDGGITFRFDFGGSARDGAAAYAAAKRALAAYPDVLRSAGFSPVPMSRPEHDTYGWYIEIRIACPTDIYRYDSASAPSRWEQLDIATERASRINGVLVSKHFAMGHGEYQVHPDTASAMAVLDAHTGPLASGERGIRTSETYVDLTPNGPGYAASWVRIVDERQALTDQIGDRSYERVLADWIAARPGCDHETAVRMALGAREHVRQRCSEMDLDALRDALVEPTAGWEDRLVERARREGVLPPAAG